ncbi:cytochrome P450 [Streptomyces albidus (ex Kaewkla and Franco 2022)]|uniref:cytochrome P450 n=1 Tax=Streptomyces albidus (ex Kaewkla and Franco 2022) TaxID=722709 RepID=UPI00281674B7|nr:cytochrome P450 [Streptomyces albidus (ex Kaewkla and Franco 2022)]
MTTPVALDVHPSETLISLTAITQSKDPHRVYGQLRLQYGPVAPVELEPGVRAWLVMGAEQLRTITEREAFFSRDARNWRDLNDGIVSPDSGLLPMMAYRPNVIGADQQEHRRLRQPLDEGISRINHRALRRQVQQICSELIDEFSRRGTADLVADYAAFVPMLAVAGLFGLDTRQGHELRAALVALFSSQADSQVGNRSFEQILFDTLQERQRNPTADLTTALMDHPNLQDDPEVLQSMVVMVSAGNETTTCWIAHTLYRMITDTSFDDRLRGGRLGVDDALDEVLWREPPMTHMPARYALRDIDLGGQPVRHGDVLILGLSAANSDPALSPPGRRRINNRAHMAYSAGPHMCPAQDTARVITRTAVDTALHLLPGLKLTVRPDEITWNPSPWTRCPTRLLVRFAVPHGLITAPTRLRTVGDSA